MNNKKGLSAIVATVLIILLTVAGVSLVWMPITKLLTPQKFRITVERCQEDFRANSTIKEAFIKKRDDYYEMRREENRLCNDLINMSKSKICLEYYEKRDTLLSEVIELEEKLYRSTINFTVCKEVEFGKDIKLRADEKLYFRSGTDYISEEGLTIEWLDENCERRGFCNNKEKLDCYEIIDNGYYKNEKSEGLYTIPFIKFGGKGNYWSISKYQCGDYQVEVLP